MGPTAGRFDNYPLIADILRLRHELARLVGFESFADYAFVTRMAKSSKQVLDFFDDLGAPLPPAAARGIRGSRGICGPRSSPPGTWPSYSERLQGKPLQGVAGGAAAVFPTAQGPVGLFALIRRLYGIRVRERPGVAVWHPSVRYYDLLDQNERIVAGFFLDPYSRAEKRSGAWMDECVIAKSLPDGQRTARGAAGLQFYRADRQRRPSLLTHDEVTTLFHEFGHGLHHMLTRVAYPSVAGINGVAWDAVELPSQFMENYVWRPEVLPLISAHVETGEALPVGQAEALLGTRTFNAALDTLRQIELATFDFELHANFDPARARKIAETLDAVRRRVSVVPAAHFNRMPASFSHISAGGYAAGYYSYKWAEVLAADAFEAFDEAGVFDQLTASRFLELHSGARRKRRSDGRIHRVPRPPPDVRALLRQTGIAA